MKTLIQHSLLKDISRVTQMIYKEFPALYEHLHETPLSLASELKDMSIEELHEYLESLRMQWKSYSKVHGIRKFMSDTTYLRYYIELIHHPVCTT